MSLVPIGWRSNKARPRTVFRFLHPGHGRVLNPQGLRSCCSEEAARDSQRRLNSLAACFSVVEVETISQTRAYLVNWLAVRYGLSNGKVEGKLVLYLPDQPDERRCSLCLAEFTFVEKLRNRSNFPGVRAFDNSVDKQIGVLLARQLCLQVEMAPFPKH
jgi:hypothetical protein